MASAVVQGARFVDVYELLFHNSKRSYMGFAEMQVCLFADCHEWHFQAAKGSDKRHTILQEGRFADAQESRFQVANAKIWAVLSSNETDLLMFRNTVFRLRSVQK